MEVDAADIEFPEVELRLEDVAWGVLYYSGWKRKPWWAFWKKPPKSVLLDFKGPDVDPCFKVTIDKQGMFIIHLPEGGEHEIGRWEDGEFTSEYQRKSPREVDNGL